MFVNESGQKKQSLLYKTFHRCFLTSFGLFDYSVSEEKIFLKLTNQKQELLMLAMFGNWSGRNVQLL